MTSTLSLPEPDDALSPVTGWTRGHWEAVADHWLGQVRRYGSPGGGLPRLPGRVTRDGERRESMETVGRSFLLAAPRIAGARGADADGILEWYSRALLAGTRPGGDEEWPTGVTCRLPLVGVTNSIVEAANVAFGLYVSRDKLWANLTRPEQLQLAGWLRHHARAEVWQNNWQLFPAMAEAFLTSVGEDTRGCIGERNVARVESWYLGDGWYTDGPEHSIDYYNAWAIHPYLWAWYRMTGRTQTPDGIRHLGRLREFVGSYSRMFAPDGSTLHVGRSLTYRTAVLGALWCAELSGVNPLSPGATRRLASGVLSRFVEKGVGVGAPLSLGWYDAFEPMCQEYSGFGSPYLAGIGFLGLAIDPDAPVWAEPEATQPTDSAPFADAIVPVGWTVVSQSDGIVRLINHGSDHCGLPVGDGIDPDDPHYAKFAYSTHTAPGTGDAWLENVDSHLALLDADGVASRRCALRGTRIEGPISGSVQLPQLNRRVLAGCAVTTVSMVDGTFELRPQLVETTTAWKVREGGFAVADDEPLATATVDCGGWVRNRDGLTGAIIGIHGWQDAGIFDYTGSNAMGEHSATPALFGECGPGKTVLVALHVLTRSDAPAARSAEADIAAWRDTVAVEVDGTVVRARWASGAVTECDLDSFVPWDHHVGPKP